MPRFRFTCRFEGDAQTFEEIIEAPNEESARSRLLDQNTADHFEILAVEEVTS